VTQVVYPNQSWESFDYDPSTGWVTQDITPYKYSEPGDPSAGQEIEYSYSTANSGGTAADTTMLVGLPRQTLDEIDGVIVSSSLTRFEPMGGESEPQVDFLTRYGVGNAIPAWSSAQLQSTTTEAGDDWTQITPTGTVFDDIDGLIQNISNSFGNNLISQSDTTVTPFGGLVSSVTSGIGQDAINAVAMVPGGSSADPFGRTTGTRAGR
jgi:hypothetical protein